MVWRAKRMRKAGGQRDAGWYVVATNGGSGGDVMESQGRAW